MNQIEPESIEKTDEDLMLAYVRKSSIDDFTLLYKRYERRLYQFFYRRLNFNREEIANDLFQLTWLKVHQFKKRFDPQQSFSSWFFTIALNNLRDFFREKKLTVEVELDEQMMSAPSDTKAEVDLILKERLRSAEKALQVLTPAQREVILLSDVEGFHSKEIAEILHISDGAVRQLLFKARAKLVPFREND